MLVRIVSMLTRLGRRENSVNEAQAGYGADMIDNDYDNDKDHD